MSLLALPRKKKAAPPPPPPRAINKTISEPVITAKPEVSSPLKSPVSAGPGLEIKLPYEPEVVVASPGKPTSLNLFTPRPYQPPSHYNTLPTLIDNNLAFLSSEIDNNNIPSENSTIVNNSDEEISDIESEIDVQNSELYINNIYKTNPSGNELKDDVSIEDSLHEADIVSDEPEWSEEITKNIGFFGDGAFFDECFSIQSKETKISQELNKIENINTIISCSQPLEEKKSKNDVIHEFSSIPENNKVSTTSSNEEDLLPKPFLRRNSMRLKNINHLESSKQISEIVPKQTINILVPPPPEIRLNRHESTESWNNFLKQLDQILERKAEFV